MALLTPLPLVDAQRIGAFYGLDVASVVGIPQGSVNSNFEIRVASGERFFLRVFEEQGRTAAAEEARLLDHIAGQGVSTPRPLAREGGSFIAEHAGKPVAMFPWIGGDVLCQERVTPDAARQVGAALAAVHLAGRTFEGAPESRFGPALLRSRIDKLASTALVPELGRTVRDLAAALDAFIQRPPVSDGLIHGDLFRDNVLFHSGRVVALLDFESASRGSYPFDFMVAVLAWCFGADFDVALCRGMAAGYVGVRPMPAAERNRLFDDGRFAALRFTITRITDFELRPAGTGIHKDYRRFLARSHALERLGPGGLADMLGLPR